MGEPELNSEGLNMTKWYEMVAFDIFGELGKPHCCFTALLKGLFMWSNHLVLFSTALGESFYSIEDGMMSAFPLEHSPTVVLRMHHVESYRKTTLLVIIG